MPFQVRSPAVKLAAFVAAVAITAIAAGFIQDARSSSPPLTLAEVTPAARRATAGPLCVSPQNPRYFADSTGHPVYLTGAHTWDNLQDIGIEDPPTPFRFDEYLGSLEQRRHNFIRLWRYESARVTDPEFGRVLYCQPHPWPRSGDAAAIDGKPQFDLSQFDQAYFDRLRERVVAAGRRGIYVSVMLFEGWALRFTTDAWNTHPFNRANNINGIDADVNGDGRGLEYATLTNPEITRLQEAYVRKVIDTVNDLDNVLYEISNENHNDSHAWEAHFARFVRDYERLKPVQHPIGMTSNGGGGPDDTARLFDGPADWISPNGIKFDYLNQPPAADGSKVIITDTDHLWGLGGDRGWVWKSFLRGLNPIFMDPHRGSFWLDRGENTRWESIRDALGQTARFAARLDLARMIPQPDLASSGYCLAHVGEAYLVYLPQEALAQGTSQARQALHSLKSAFLPKVAVDLSGCSSALDVEWFDPTNDAVRKAAPVKGGGRIDLTAPFSGDAVLFLRAISSAP